MMMGDRPLSPHLQIYKPQLTSFMSILHRMTGLFLAGFLLFIPVWLWALAHHHELHTTLASFFQGWFGRLLLWMAIGAFWYHMSNGIRHLIWDTGRNLTLKGVYASGYFVLSVALICTLLTIILSWFVYY